MSLSKPSILITGGAGFIGSHIAKYFVKQGENIRILDNFSSGTRDNLQLEYSAEEKYIEIIEDDIGYLKNVLIAMKGIKEVFHEAAFVSVPLSIKQPHDSFHSNALGTFNIFEAARLNNISKIVFASSAAVYGNNYTTPLKETDSRYPLSPYALDKVYTEDLASLYYKIYGLSSIGLRYFNVYGPGQRSNSPYSSVIPKFIDLLLANKTPSIHGDGYQTRDFIHIDDVVNANIHSMRLFNKPGHYIFNVGTGKSTSIKKLFELLQHILKKHVQPTYLCTHLEEIRHSCANIHYTYQQMKWKYKWELKQGLTKYVNTLT